WVSETSAAVVAVVTAGGRATSPEVPSAPAAATSSSEEQAARKSEAAASVPTAILLLNMDCIRASVANLFQLRRSRARHTHRSADDEHPDKADARDDDGDQRRHGER